MAYADQEMSGSRIVAIIIVALIHVAVGYALVTGLAYSAVKKAIERVTTVDIEEPEEEPEEEPPPPEPDVVPPPVAPPPPINIAVAPPPIQVQTVIPPPAPVARVVPPPAPPAPPPPPPPQRANPEPRNNQSSWVTTADYPARALREEREGVTRVNLTVGADGRVSNCAIAGSSGSSDLDETACRNIQRRARFNPKLDSQGREVTGSFSFSVRWQIPER